jgi:hypothetical protein
MAPMRTTRAWKIAAVACSIALGGAYVVYRSVRAAESREAPPPAVPTAEPPPDVPPREMFGGSKSLIGIGTREAAEDAERRAAEEAAHKKEEEEALKRALLYSSKSGVLVEPGGAGGGEKEPPVAGK